MSQFSNYTPAQLYDTILQGNTQSDEAMYYTLTERLFRWLAEKHKALELTHNADLQDSIDDFFLYLREGNGDMQNPYSVLNTVKNKDAFEAWTVTAFRNFLSNHIDRNSHDSISNKVEEIPDTYTPYTHCKEELISHASLLIAYSHQTLPLRGQFVLIRTLLTLLSKESALPDKEMAQAMGMSHTLYRVTVHRTMQEVQKIKKSIESGAVPCLDDYHKTMAESINENFDALYSILMSYYDSTLSNLDAETAISNLRNFHYEQSGLMLHDNGITYGAMSVQEFFERLDGFLKLSTIFDRHSHTKQDTWKQQSPKDR